MKFYLKSLLIKPVTLTVSAVLWGDPRSWNLHETLHANVSHISLLLQVIALVMDVFTDVDLLCDLMEASNKRRVPVYILLDEKNLDYFTEMCSALDIQNSHLSVSTAPSGVLLIQTLTVRSHAEEPSQDRHTVFTLTELNLRCRGSKDLLS